MAKIRPIDFCTAVIEHVNQLVSQDLGYFVQVLTLVGADDNLFYKVIRRQSFCGVTWLRSLSKPPSMPGGRGSQAICLTVENSQPALFRAEMRVLTSGLEFTASSTRLSQRVTSMLCLLHTGAIYETFGRENIELSICFIIARKIFMAQSDRIGVGQYA